MKLIVLSTSLNPGSKTRLLAEAALQQLKAKGMDVDFADLRDFPLPLAGAEGSWDDANARALTERIAASQGILLSVPIYNYDANAAAKTLIELSGQAWEGKVVGFLCAAGGSGSYMSIMGLANSLMLDFRCLILPRFVYATGEAFADGKITDAEILSRIDQLCGELIQLTGSR